MTSLHDAKNMTKCVLDVWVGRGPITNPPRLLLTETRIVI